MKIICWSCLKFVLLFVFIISSLLAIYMYHKGSAFDHIREIQKLKIENRRDDALDLARFYRENQTSDIEKFSKLEKDLTYTKSEKFKSFVWYGVIRGEVHNTYSSLGAISTDLCIAGDIRDLGIQSWNYLTGAQDFDGSITLLSAVGVCLSAAPYLDGVNALAKNTIKYLKKIPANLNKGLLKKLLTGKISPQYYKKIWTLLKKTTGPFPAPYPVFPISTI